MRTLIALVALVVAASVCKAQWFQQNSGTTRPLEAVHFIDANNGWAVGTNGTILRTSNGGQEWAPQTSGTTLNLNDVCFVDASVGVAVGDGGTILRTSNGGLNWVAQISGTTERVEGVSFANSNNAIAVAGAWWISSIILRTTNSGITWTQQTLEPPEHLLDVSFTDANNGFIVGGHGWSPLPGCTNVILRTTDGGVTWTRRSINESVMFYGICFSDANTGIIVGGGELGGRSSSNSNFDETTEDVPVVFRTTDAGANWIPQMRNNEHTLVAVCLMDSNNGMAVGMHVPDPGLNLILRTTNGGTTWTEQSSPNFLFDVCFIDVLNGWTVGDNGTILHTTNGGLTFVDGERRVGVPTGFALAQNYPNPFNPSTTIRYGLPHNSFVTLTVYNMLGQQVAQLVNEQQQAGYHDVVFRADGLVSGVYFYRIQAGDFVATRKLLYLK